MTLSNSNFANILSQFVDMNVAVSAGNFISDESPYAAERQLVANAIASRRAEFFSGRYYARQALRQINVPDVPILRGEKGNPLFPSGILGSITHDGGQVVAAALASGAHRGFGVDLLLDPARVEPSLQSLIARPNELNSLANNDNNPPALALAFSLKESVVKAVSPTINRYLDLLDIELSVNDGVIVAHLTEFDVRLPCGFVLVEKGLFSFALLK